MMTATEAKLTSYRSKGYFKIVEDKIYHAANRGETSCAISIDEIPDGTPGIICEISYLLNELGYQTFIDENIVNVYWEVQKPLYYDIINDIEVEEEW